MATEITSSDTRYKEAGETRNVLVDFTGALDKDGSTNERISSITSVAATGLTITNSAVTTTPRIINGQEVPAGKAISFTVASGSNGTTYQIKCTVVTSGSQTIVRYCPLSVTAD
jgi:hypothetical protein